jgi:hypothetical protein
MRFIVTLVFIGIFLIVGFTALKTSPNEDTPLKYAKQFFVHLQDNDYRTSVANFGGNICRCPADLGWVSYLIYASNEEPNLAFMMGHRFERGDITYKMMNGASVVERKTLLERPQDFEVDVPISFDPNIYAPLFLPRDMAYGLPMQEADLKAFCADPDKDSWKSLTLRFRPSLAPGTVAMPAEAKARVDNYVKDKKRREREALEDAHRGSTSPTVSEAEQAKSTADNLVKEALDESSERKYLQVKDAGPVLDQAGKPLDLKTVENRLPRLRSCLLRLHMVRRDPTQPFTIFHFVVSDPVLQISNGPGFNAVPLQNFKPPMPEATPQSDLVRDSQLKDSQLKENQGQAVH